MRVKSCVNTTTTKYEPNPYVVRVFEFRRVQPILFFTRS